MTKKNQKSKLSEDELRENVKKFLNDTEDLNDAKKVLEGLSEKLKSFEGGLLKNENMQKAKGRHLGNLGAVLLEVLADNSSVDITTESGRTKISKLFIEKYDQEVLSVIGM